MPRDRELGDRSRGTSRQLAVHSEGGPVGREHGAVHRRREFEKHERPDDDRDHAGAARSEATGEMTEADAREERAGQHRRYREARHRPDVPETGHTIVQRFEGHGDTVHSRTEGDHGRHGRRRDEQPQVLEAVQGLSNPSTSPS
jgi:hypothetical protein